MDDVTLNVTARTLKGNKFRGQSEEVPGVVYGKDQEPLNASVPVNVLEKTYHSVGGGKVIDLKIDDNKPIKVLFQEIQSDPVSGKPIHFDMYAVTLGQKMRVEVPLRFESEPEQIKTGEAILVTIKDMIEVEANPLNLPEFVEVHLDDLKEIGDTILVGDLKVSGDVTIVADPEEAVVKLDVPREEEPEPEEESDETSEGEEGESSADESGEGSDDNNSAE